MFGNNISKTKISISEKVYNHYDVNNFMRREDQIIIHDGYQWYMGKIHNRKELEEMLNFFKIELTAVDYEVEYRTTGKITYYNLSKNINNSFIGGFWSLEQLKEMSNGKELKKFKGLSNGSIVDCYAFIGEKVINIYRPNPNAKEVYVTMNIDDEINYKRNNWYL